MSPMPRTDDQAHSAVGTLMGFDEPADTATRQPTSDLPLQRAVLQAFGSHQHSDLAFAQPVTFLVGPNGGGKSTIPEAILWALTGKYARGLDGRGAGVRDLVQTGRTAMRVTLAVRAGELLREVTKDGKTKLTLGDAPADQDQQTILYGALQTSEARLRAVFHGAMLLEVDHAAAKEFLLDVLQVRIPIGAESLTLAQLDVRYEKAFDERRRAKQDRAALQVPPRPEQPAPDVAALEQLLTQLRDEERRLIAASAEAAGARGQLETRLQDLRRRKADLDHRLQGYGDPHADLDLVARKITALEADVEDPAVATAEAAEVTDLQTKLVDARGRLTLLEGSLGAIEKHAPDKGCVMNADIPCQTPAKEFKGKLAAFKKEVTQLRRQVEEATPRLKLLEAQANGRAQAAGDRARRRATLEQDRSRLQNRARDLQGDQDAHAALLTDIASVQEELTALGPAEVNPELAALRERIRKGEETVPRARALAKDWEAHTEASRKADALAKRVEQLELLVEQLGPKGARVEALAAAVNGFTARINTYLGRFGYSLAFDVDPWCVRVNGRPSSRLSPSERFRVGASLQLALAELTGLNLAVIDNADVLVTPEARATFNQLAIGWALEAPGRQVIVIAAKEDDWQLPPIPQVAVYRVRQDGEGISRVTLERDGAAVAA